jgi:hypothetical protein
LVLMVVIVVVVVIVACFGLLSCQVVRLVSVILSVAKNL